VSHYSGMQTIRRRELSRIVFGEGSAPKYGPAMLVPEFCGKWLVHSVSTPSSRMQTLTRHSRF
ncbi:uncharacterized protein LAESUDRAFT_733121, partial [Laetiporus sulphureus 93-53]